MTFIEHTVVTGLYCDATRCTTRYEPGTAPVNPFGAMRFIEREAAKLGWTFWMSRGGRSYCSEHGPVLPTKMRQRGPL